MWAALASTTAVSRADEPASTPALTVCADPANLPFSNDRLEGFENKLAELIAADLGRPLRYRWVKTWRASYLRDLRSGKCDVLMGVSNGIGGIAVTRPYYTSTYVLLTSKSGTTPSTSFDDPLWRTLRIGLHVLGTGGANTPPAMALARHGLASRIVGYPMWGADDAGPVPGRLVNAVDAGDVDTAIVWGPIAGYYNRSLRERLSVTALTSDPLTPASPFIYAIGVGLRNQDAPLKLQIEGVLDRRHEAVQKILADFGVPLVAAQPPLSQRL